MAKFGNLPEVVVFTEFGVEHKALVIGSRELEHHTGENGEQLLNLVIVKPVVRDECVKCHFPERNHGKPFPPGASNRPCDSFEGVGVVAAVNPSEYVHIATDVAHESHAFTEGQLTKLAAKGLAAYPGGQLPGGRWREIDPIAVPSAVVAAEPEAPTKEPDPPKSEEPPPVVN